MSGSTKVIVVIVGIAMMFAALKFRLLERARLMISGNIPTGTIVPEDENLKIAVIACVAENGSGTDEVSMMEHGVIVATLRNRARNAGVTYEDIYRDRRASMGATWSGYPRETPEFDERQARIDVLAKKYDRGAFDSLKEAFRTRGVPVTRMSISAVAFDHANHYEGRKRALPRWLAPYAGVPEYRIGRIIFSDGSRVSLKKEDPKVFI